MKMIKQLMTALLLLVCIEGFGQVSLTATGGTTTGSYTTLNAAFAAINAGTHQGAINISITGNTTEPAPPSSLLGSGVGSASYTGINISPSGGSWTVTSASAPQAYRGIIELFGAQHVTIDGDPAATGTSHLTFYVVPSTALSTSAIRLGSADTSVAGSASYDTVRNCAIIAGCDSAHAATLSYGIVVSGSSITNVTTPTATHCSNNTFVNNNFSRSNYAIYLLGGGGNTNNLIRGNHFVSNTSGNNSCYDIYLSSFLVRSTTATIDSNDFTGLSTSGLIYSIYSYSCLGQLTVSDNNFHNFSGTGSIYAYRSYDGYLPGVFGSPRTGSIVFSGNTLQNCSGGSTVCLYYEDGSQAISRPIGSSLIYGNKMNNVTGAYNAAGILITYMGPDSILCHDNRITNVSASNGIIGIGGTGYSTYYNNVISGLSSTGAGFAYGIYAQRSTLYNNMISDITATPTSPLSGATGSFTFFSSTMATAVGLYINSGKAYSNTIALNTPNRPASAPNAQSMAVYGVSTGFYNNIVYNSQNSTGAFGIYGNPTGDTLDYNTYYVPYGIMGYASANQATLADWQGATSQDLHSVSGPVPFLTPSDLHIDTLNAGANNVFRNGFAGYTSATDIDGQTRNNPPCIGADEFQAVNALPDSIVWPGDADNSRLVDNTDLLPIGLGYDSTGPVRAVTGIVWQGDVANNWSNYFLAYAPTVNFNHADCNGDGVINASDTAAILANFSLTHAKSSGYSNQWRSGVPSLRVAFSLDTVLNGQVLSTDVYLGDSTLPVNNIYGLAFTLNYDPIVNDSTTVSFSFVPSWLGSSSNSINIHKTFTATGEVKAAVTGINHTSRSGYGRIATFIGTVTTGNINGKDLSYYHNLVYISDITAIDRLGNPIALNAGIDSNSVGYYSNGIHDIGQATQVNVYPNPASTSIHVTSGSDISEITITDMLGQNVRSIKVNSKQSETINIADIQSGIYLVRVSTATGIAITRLAVSR